MTTLFIWDDYETGANWDSFHEKYNISASDKRAGDLEGHAAIMISDDWETPFLDVEETLAILDYYNKLYLTWQTVKQGGGEYTRTKRLMEKLGELFSSCLTDESDYYVSASSDVYRGTGRSIWHDLLRKGRVPARSVGHIFHGTFPDPEVSECNCLDLDDPENHPDFVHLWPDGEPVP